MALNKAPITLSDKGIQARNYEPLKNFLDIHNPVRTDDANGNGDDVFNAANITTIDRSYERHGYDSGEDHAVYDYHNQDVLDAMLRTREAVKGMWQQQWQQTRDADN